MRKWNLQQYLYDYADSVFFSELGNEINCMDVNVGKSRYATAGKDLAVRIYDGQTFTVSLLVQYLYIHF